MARVDAGSLCGNFVLLKDLVRIKVLVFSKGQDSNQITKLILFLHSSSLNYQHCTDFPTVEAITYCLMMERLFAML